ncbi:lysoplasmalogenase [Aquidulcibacter sp.]|uniref:lysoplasmalogenase n=1 Tax=Aquidulcibacter sp. TaxID=2052990 RepID=UPI0025C430E2|nr:lysoplasmalogenase [Aquidulcibacter sp.]MCA3696415.1 lysoplasmalogenase [Aquidulcibacter sp.]
MLINFAEPMVWLWMLSASAAALYGLIFNKQAPNPVRSLMKTAAVAGLALVVWQAQGPSFLLFALAASAVGDLLLAGPGEKRFMAGVVAFAIAHGFYIPLFLEFGAFKHGLAAWQVVAALALLVTSAGLLFGILWRHLGPMKGPLSVYFVIILGMCFSALALPTSPYLTYAVIGVVAFATSDMILGFEMFALKPDSPWHRVTSAAVWTLYYGGQALITLGILNEWGARLVAGQVA